MRNADGGCGVRRVRRRRRQCRRAGLDEGAGLVVAKEAQPEGGTRGGKRASVAAAPSPDVQQPKVTRIAPEDGGMAIYAENLKGYMRVKTGKDLTLSDGVTPAVQADGSSEPVRIVVPKDGDSGFYKVIRNQ